MRHFYSSLSAIKSVSVPRSRRERDATDIDIYLINIDFLKSPLHKLQEHSMGS
jgi:hypothetical protein